jgi:hypothetical protein
MLGEAYAKLVQGLCLVIVMLPGHISAKFMQSLQIVSMSGLTS